MIKFTESHGEPPVGTVVRWVGDGGDKLVHEARTGDQQWVYVVARSGTRNLYQYETIRNFLREREGVSMEPVE